MAWQTPKTNWGQPGQTVPGVDDFNRIEENIRIIGEYNRAPGYGVANGTNIKTITLDPAPVTYYDGLCFAFKNVTQNTGAVTINVNGLGARPVKKPNGNDVAAGNLKAGSIYTVRYNASTQNFILQGSDSSGNATPDDVRAGKTFSNDNDTGIIGTLDLKYRRLFLNNYDAEGVDVVLGNIPANGTKYVNISVPAGRKAVILEELFMVEYVRPPWTGKFDVWGGDVFLKSIQVIDDTTWELKFENESDYSQGCGRFYMHIFYV